MNIDPKALPTLDAMLSQFSGDGYWPMVRVLDYPPFGFIHAYIVDIATTPRIEFEVYRVGQADPVPSRVATLTEALTILGYTND